MFQNVKVCGSDEDISGCHDFTFVVIQRGITDFGKSTKFQVLCLGEDEGRSDILDITLPLWIALSKEADFFHAEFSLTAPRLEVDGVLHVPTKKFFSDMLKKYVYPTRQKDLNIIVIH